MSEYPVEPFLAMYRNDLERQIEAAETELAFWSNMNSQFSAKTPDGLRAVQSMNMIRQHLSDKCEAIKQTRAMIDRLDCYDDHIEFHSGQLHAFMDDEESAG